MKKLLILLSICLLIPMTLWADPSVTGASGTLSHGQTVTITGSGFGSKSTAAPLVWDNLEDGVYNTAATVGSWSRAYDPPSYLGTINSTSPQRSALSSYNLSHNFTTECVSGFQIGPDSSTWYVSYWFYLGSDWTWGTSSETGNLGNIKFYRMWSTGGSTVNNFTMSCDGVHDITTVMEAANQNRSYDPVVAGYDWVDDILGNGDPGWVDNDHCGWKDFETNASPNWQRETWHHFQWEYRDSDINTANGVVRCWWNGKLIFDKHDIITRTTTDTSYKRPSLVGFYNSHGQSPDGNDHFYMDDAYADTTWSRVEIGNASTYATCTHREIQPPTSWADGSIAITFNQGSFSAEDTAYVYVVDSTGAVNSSGYEITIGGSESPSTPTISGCVQSGGVAR